MQLLANTTGGCGGMADASDSKSDAGNSVWVQVPPSALKAKLESDSMFSFFQYDSPFPLPQQQQNDKLLLRVYYYIKIWRYL